LSGTIAAHARDANRLELVSDQDTGQFRFVIDGKTAAYVDHRGLYVPGSITYGDVLTDAGRAGTEKEAETHPQPSEEPHAP